MYGYRMPKLRRPDASVVRTTVELPPDLWRAAKVRAMNERSDLRSVIIAALRAYLTSTKGERR
jgi:hypothetical protein